MIRLSLAFLSMGLGAANSSPLVAQTAGSVPKTHVLVVSGLGGEPEYSELFRTQALTLLDALQDRWGVGDDATVWLAEDPAAEPSRIADKATRESVERELISMARRAGPADVVLILLLGHGSGRGEESRLNLPGPDLTGADLSVWLNAFPTQTVAVVNTASASGGFVSAVAGDRRIVVTATRSTRERELTHFGAFFVDAFARDQADTDKDERVSLLEAFLYAKGEVERFYERDNQMLTEHALLDDNGDGEGSLEPTVDGPDGLLASRFFVAAASRAVTAAAEDDPELAALLEKKRQLEADIGALRARRDELSAEQYDDRLEALLVDLALTNRAVRERGGDR